MVTWESIYQKNGVVQKKVDPFVDRNIGLLKEYGDKVYDYGAGTGRNAIYLAKSGFEVITFDPSLLSKALLRGRIDNGLENDNGLESNLCGGIHLFSNWR